MARTALFVIDIQRELAQNPQTEIPHAQRIRDAGDAILSRARSNIDGERSSGNLPNLKIIVVQHEESPEDGTMVRGSKAWELVYAPRQGNDAESLVSKTVGT